MKRLVLFAAVISALSFVACKKQAQEVSPIGDDQKTEEPTPVQNDNSSEDANGAQQQESPAE